MISFLGTMLRFGLDQMSMLDVASGRLDTSVVIVNAVRDVCEAQFPVVTVIRWPPTISTMISSEKMS